MSEFKIQDLSSNHKYRTELPNILFEVGINATLIGVYSALKRCAGDHGNCTKSERRLAKELGATPKSLRVWINQLCEVNPKLNKSLIIVQRRLSESGDKDTNCISIVDLWPDNYRYFSDLYGGEVKITPREVKITPGGSKITAQVGEILPQGGVKITDKEEQQKKNLYEEEATTTQKSQNDVVDVFSFLKNFSLEEKDVKAIKKALKKFSPERILLAGEYSKHVEPTKDLISMLIWHCKEEEPPIPPMSNEQIQKQNIAENKKYALKVSNECEAKNYRIDILQNSIEFVPNSGQIAPDVLNFTCKTFKKDLENILKDRKFTRKKL